MKNREETALGELFSLGALEEHARQLANRHRVARRRGLDQLLPRLRANERILRAYNTDTLEIQKGRRLTPASEWLLDNFYLIEEQIRTVRRHLPRGFNRELPHLTEGPCEGYPRVYEIALQLIAHVDGRVDEDHLTRFISAYQEVVALKLGELWAVPIMLRVALIENLRRIVERVEAARVDRNLADRWAGLMLEQAETDPAKLIVTVAQMANSKPVLSSAFVTEFRRSTQEKSPALTLAFNWIDAQLVADGVTIDQLVQLESQRQAADQVSIGNSISSLRFLDAMDWKRFVETLSAVEKWLRQDPAGVYERMDFATRDTYRHVVERMAKHCPHTEAGVARTAVTLASRIQPDTNPQARHVGYYLVGRGEAELAKAISQRLPVYDAFNRMAREMPLLSYAGGIAAIAALTAAVVIPLCGMIGSSWWALGVFAILLAMCASQLGVSLVNWMATVFVRPKTLPRLDFSAGIPVEYCTMVVVPSMLSSASGVERLLDGLEVHYFANRDENVYFALLTDFRDAPSEQLPGDDVLLDQVRNGIEALNRKYQRQGPSRFYLFHRNREWNAQEQTWMGYERKRGKLMDLNACLRSRDASRFPVVVGDVESLPRIKYVITLDADTQLPRDAARHLAGSMAHSLNRPQYDRKAGRVVAGYGILQPRVAVSLPSASRSRFSQLFAGEPGIDPYTRTVSDVYQDLFQEGSFIGKGIYDVDAFEQALADRLPENRILSHDLLEGSYARSGLVTDVLLFEEFPAHYTVDTRRRHRWMRGDWQIAAWLLPRVPGSDARRVVNPISGLSRWKVFDNLRRTLVPAALMGLLVSGWLTPDANGLAWTLFVALIIWIPGVLPVLADLLQKPKERPTALHLRNALHELTRQSGQAILTLAFLPFDAWISLDAMFRTLSRLAFTKRHLLEWQTASDAQLAGEGDLKGYFSTMWSAPALALVIGASLFGLAPTHAYIAAPLLLLWLAAPSIAWWIGRPLDHLRPELPPAQIRFLEQLARRTWAYFDTFVNAQENWLPPDNFQEHPAAVIASRTSPTNIGMALLGTLAAWDFGYIPVAALLRRIDGCFLTLRKLDRYRGHFYNWYDTRTLAALNPLYISTVDNGNFAGALLVLRSGLQETTRRATNPKVIAEGIRTTFDIVTEHAPSAGGALLSRALESARTTLRATPRSLSELQRWLKELRDALAALPMASAEGTEFQWWRNALTQQCQDHLDDLKIVSPWLDMHSQVGAPRETESAGFRLLREVFSALDEGPGPLDDATLQGYVEKVRSAIGMPGSSEHEEKTIVDLAARLESALQLARQRSSDLNRLAQQCLEFAEMDFTLLYDTERDLFSIGYNVATHRMDGSFYDLLASEARLTSFVAIALGQVPQEHWFTLGRLLTSVDGVPALISWSGSMFEYLMPPLIMPQYDQTLLDASCRSAVDRQIAYGKQTHQAWGISESGYNFTDAQSNYQYRAFGVPGLGFKRGLAEDMVIAPYASAMALMVRPHEACKNLERLKDDGALARYGFYEAVDHTPARVPPGHKFALVRSFMAHHEGMTLLALASHLLDRPMQRRFQENPFFKAVELLLQERVPKDTTYLFPHELEATRAAPSSLGEENSLRIFRLPDSMAPEVHLLSNGRYHVMITSAGGGYSRWNGHALTRWREDPTRDCWGSFIYLRDRVESHAWSAAHQPYAEPSESYEAIFSQGRAEFRQRRHGIDSHTEISVSPEEDVEVRRITLTNRGNEARDIELTSYAEVVLSPQPADLAHPAFNKLFVQTQILRDQQAILCSRRPRSRGEQPPWMVHLMLVRATEVDSVSFETDRAKFLGRGRNPSAPEAMRPEVGSLSNTEGSVLDPMVAIRRTIRLEPKQTGSVFFVTGGAETREAAMRLIEKYQDRAFADRVFELAWTHGTVTLRHLNATEAEAQLYARLASPLLYAQSQRRAPAALLARNQRSQRFLWSFGISGDLPIVLLRATQAENMGFIREVLQAHAYWRLKGLTVDLVIINEDNSVYRQNIHDQITALIAAGIGAQLADKPGGVYVRRYDQLSPEDVLLLQCVARIVLTDDGGSLAEFLQRRPAPEPPMPKLVPLRKRFFVATTPEAPLEDLAFFNGQGGFTADGREYIVRLNPGESTPAPWCNILGNPRFGTQISESGGGYTWAENCHEFRLTTWHNDPVSDHSGEALYLRDEHTGRFWSLTPLPAPGTASYTVRHGMGYSVYEHVEDGIRTELWVYVAIDSPVKFLRLIVQNQSDRARSLTVTSYWEWVLGEHRRRNLMHIAPEFDVRQGAMLIRNPYNNDFGDRVAFAAASESLRSWTTDRTEFIGRNRTMANPMGLSRNRLSGRVSHGLDPCTALQLGLELAPLAQQECVFRMGAARDRNEANQLLQKYKSTAAAYEALQAVWSYWNRTLGAVQVDCPDPAVNVLVNGWLLYQTISCRLWARTGFYQSGGAYGFRDQLQDAMAVVHSRPELLREQMIRAAAHQFLEGDVQHWWHPPADRGVRTHFSDDYLWLPYAVCRYVETTGDTGVLEENIPYITGRPLRPEEESYYDMPHPAGQSGTLYDHCVKAIRYGLKFGEHGLPLIGCGDWNDGMNLVGEHGKGESVWLAFFLFGLLKQFGPLARKRNDLAMGDLCEEQAGLLRQHVEQHSWDGRWYHRAYFDNGQPLGSSANPECQIDALPQAWAVLSGLADPDRCRTAMEAVAHRLVRRDAKLIQLFDPPFDKSDLEPGYIKGYVPGVRENGGQYTHAAIWTVMAFAAMGDANRAWELLDLINPVRHAATPQDAARYKVEPYVMAADIYSVEPHTGRGGWTWYTGSAGWMYRLILESLLGVRLQAQSLTFEPCLRSEWKSFKLDYRFRQTPYRITLNNLSGTWKGTRRIVQDGIPLENGTLLPLVDDRKEHVVEVSFV